MVFLFDKWTKRPKPQDPIDPLSTPSTGDALLDHFLGEVDEKTGLIDVQRIALRSSSEDLQGQIDRYQSRIVEGELALRSPALVHDAEASTTERQHLDLLRQHLEAHEHAFEIALQREVKEELLFERAEAIMRNPKTEDTAKIAAIEEVASHISAYVQQLGTTKLAHVDLARLQAMAAAVQMKHTATKSSNWLSLRAKIDKLCQRLWATRDADERRMSVAHTNTVSEDGTTASDGEDDIAIESLSDVSDDDIQPPA